MYEYELKHPQSNIKSAKLFKKGLNSIYMKVDYDDLIKTKFNIDISISRDDSADSMVTMTPINENGSLFYYNLKQNIFVPTGSFSLNGKTIDLNGAFVTYDSGRGAWPIKSGWIWANGNGFTSNNQPIGINIGHGFSNPDSSRATEDCFTVNGKVFKLPAMKTEQPSDPLKPWKFTVSNEFTQKENKTGNTCHIEFKLIKRKFMGSNMIIGKMSFGINYGQFVGVCKDSEGKEYLFEKVYGIIEEKRSVW
jgi:hypothetical protein